MNQIAEAAGYTTNEKGERIIASTRSVTDCMVPLMVVEWLLNNPCSCRRADGTLRKERKVKPGYIPQDEQPMYVSRGSMVRAPGQLSPSGVLNCAPLYPSQPVQAKQNVPKCPGMPEADAAAPKLSKTARKNAKRKEQRQAAAEGTGGDSSGSAADGAAEQLQYLRWGTVAGVLPAASISGHEAEGNCPACLQCSVELSSLQGKQQQGNPHTLAGQVASRCNVLLIAVKQGIGSPPCLHKEPCGSTEPRLVCRLNGISASAGPSGSKQAASSHTVSPASRQQAGRAAAAHTQYPPGLEVPPGFEPSSRVDGAGSSAVAAEKQIKALRKKIRGAEATEQKQKEGKPLLPEEVEKLERVKEW